MFYARAKKCLFYLTAAVMALGLMAQSALAQCPMCRLSVAGATDGAAVSKGLNLAILVLLIPPVTIFCTIFRLAYKHRKARGVERDDVLDGEFPIDSVGGRWN